ncbi:unnamed protein product [Schistocephalus solidus]|uniref:Uncharacterized protein n=1 Tax=Schistocephalus solidus TaxID=70667 RepID=A0A183TT29_SCHSO|nr:unnamed protein product [Schistocephalus solidus]
MTVAVRRCPLPWQLLKLGPPAGCKSESHLGDDETMVCPNICITDRLGHQHVLPISPPDENIVQQLPAPRPRVHPRGLLRRRKAEEGTTVRTGQLTDAEVDAATGELVYAYYVHDLVVQIQAPECHKTGV